MAAYAPVMAEITIAELARMPRDRPFALHDQLQAITLDVPVSQVHAHPSRGRRWAARRVRRRMAAPDPAGTDILALLLASRDEAGVAMTEDELCDELVTMLVAGHETTATGLSRLAAGVEVADLAHLPPDPPDVVRRVERPIDFAGYRSSARRPPLDHARARRWPARRARRRHHTHVSVGALNVAS